MIEPNLRALKEQILGARRSHRSGIDRVARINDIGKESDNRVPAELREIERRLRDERPTLTELELDEVKLRAKRSAAQGSDKLRKQKGTFMKSRFALLVILSLGVLACGAGGTLAASAVAASGSAGSAQYEPDEHEFCEEGGSGGGENGCEEPCEESGGGSAGAGQYEPGCSHPCDESESGAASAQLGEHGEGCAHKPASLPFTGFPAIPVLIVGLGLLGAGLAMRMRSGGRLA